MGNPTAIKKNITRFFSLINNLKSNSKLIELRGLCTLISIYLCVYLFN